MKVVAKLCRLEPDEYAAEDVEDNEAHKLSGSDTGTLGECIVDVAHGWPDGAEADVHHLPTDNGLDTIPNDGEQDPVEDRKIGSPHSPDAPRHDGIADVRLSTGVGVENGETGSKKVTDQDGDNRLPPGHTGGEKGRSGLVGTDVHVDEEPELNVLQ